MRTRYKLARVCNGKYLSANQNEFRPVRNRCLEYKVGEVTECGNTEGVACYKTLKDCDKKVHIEETMMSFNGGGPIVILKLKPIGKPLIGAETIRYRKGGYYAGGINYKAVEVIEVVRTITK